MKYSFSWLSRQLHQETNKNPSFNSNNDKIIFSNLLLSFYHLSFLKNYLILKIVNLLIIDFLYYKTKIHLTNPQLYYFLINIDQKLIYMNFHLFLIY